MVERIHHGQPVAQVSYRPGLVGVDAAQTSISKIDPETDSLIYRGFQISDLAGHFEVESIVRLLWLGDVGDVADRALFREDLSSLRKLTEPMLNQIVQASKGSDSACAVLRRVFTDLGDVRFRSTAAQRMRCYAVSPTIIAAFWRLKHGLAVVDPNLDLGHSANFWYMLTARAPTIEVERALDGYFVLLSEHAMNASTFTARVAASTGAGLFPAVEAALAVHEGGLHGGALPAVDAQLEAAKASSEIAEWVNSTLIGGERLMGFGHPMYQLTDPRSALLESCARDVESTGVDFANRFEEVALERLRAEVPGEHMATNVEFYSAVLLRALGVPRELMQVTFSLARMAGWLAHFCEQQEQQQAGRSSVIHPESEYIGQFMDADSLGVADPLYR